MQLDGQLKAARVGVGDGRPVVRIGERVRMRRRVGEVAPDLAIVGLANPIFLVTVVPRPQNALRISGWNDHGGGLRRLPFELSRPRRQVATDREGPMTTLARSGQAAPAAMGRLEREVRRRFVE